MKLLVVDDSSADIELLAVAVASLGVVELTPIVDAIVARDLLATMDPRRFDIIMVDWRLPVMNGDQVAKAFLSRQDRDRSVPFIFLSTAMPPNIRSKLQDSGCIVIDKPVDLEGFEALAKFLAQLGNEFPT